MLIGHLKFNTQSHLFFENFIHQGQKAKILDINAKNHQQKMPI